jgi:large subunit ribosomal protein L29
MKASDLREKSTDDLRELEKSLASDVFQNRLKNFTNRLDDTSAIRKTKRELARVTTLLREAELGIRRTASPAKAEKAAPAAEAKVEAKPKKAAPKKAEKAEGATKTKTAKKSEAKKS